MTSDLTQIRQKLRGTFFEESFEGLERLEAGLLCLQHGGSNSSAIIDEIFRAAHSIKGGAGTFGMETVTELAHGMESVLDRIRSRTLSPSASLLALLLEGVDVLRDMLRSFHRGEAISPTRTASLEARLSVFAGPSHEPQKNVDDNALHRAHIRFEPKSHLLETGNDVVLLFRELAELGTLSTRVDVSELPTLAELNPAECHLKWDLELETTASLAQIRDTFAWVEDDAEIRISLHDATPSVHSVESSESDASGVVTRFESHEGLRSIRVGLDKIELLLNMVG